MKPFKRRSWQNKIDPAFDRMIISYVKFLETCEALPEGYLSLYDLSKQLELEEPWWKHVYVKDKGCVDRNENGETTDDIDQDILNIFHYTSEDKKAYFETFLKIAEELPEESKAFYVSKIQLFIADTAIKPPFSLYEKPDKNNMDLYSVIGLLIMRSIFISLEDGKYSDVTEEEKGLFNENPEAMIYLNGFINVLLSSIVYKETQKSLLDKFVNGDDKALFKAISINKSLLYCKEVKDRVLKAQFTGDKKFFNGLGNAIATRRFSNVKGYGRLFPVLIIFWSFGLYRLTRHELYDLLIQSKVITRQISMDALDKFIQRYILSYFKN